MNIRMIGTGSAFAKTFYQNNALIESGGRTLLLDCGSTAPLALHRLGVDIGDIAAILISHIHADHVGGLEEIGFRMKFIYGRKPVLYAVDTLFEPLWEHTLKGGMQQEGLESIDAFFDCRPLRAGQPAELIPGLVAEPILTRHIPNKPSYSFLFNGSFFYSADMVFDPELLKHLTCERGVRTIFHDCQLHPPGAVHACLPELLTLPEEIQERIWLMHYGDDQPNFVGRTGKMRFVVQHRVYSF